MTTTPDDPDAQYDNTERPGEDEAEPESNGPAGDPSSDANPDAPDQDASANKINTDQLDDAPTADRDPAEGSNEAGED